VIVDDTQLSLAIGKKGQNVRLAAKLLGWKIDIKSEEEKRQEVEQQMQASPAVPPRPSSRSPSWATASFRSWWRRHHHRRGAGRHDARAARRDSRHRRKDAGTISVAVRHYFGQFEEGEEGHVPGTAEGASAPNRREPKLRRAKRFSADRNPAKRKIENDRRGRCGSRGGKRAEEDLEEAEAEAAEAERIPSGRSGSGKRWKITGGRSG
jgi:transcription termination/antitermination protein NusA